MHNMERPNFAKKERKQVHFDERPQTRPPETMASWLDQQFSSHRVQLVATAVLSGAAVAATIYGTQAIRRKERVDELKASIPELNEKHHAEMVFYTLR